MIRKVALWMRYVIKNQFELPFDLDIIYNVLLLSWIVYCFQLKIIKPMKAICFRVDFNYSLRVKLFQFHYNYGKSAHGMFPKSHEFRIVLFYISYRPT